ncbi:TIGR00304 family membrane protein [Methanolapillus ohkumae]|uniref:DUF131 domain-containing protein n=1 Tax=Methanolapillus ohkumae TaxID=3028298 RepID=A0AA96V867_9EURY|nr:hypothetical protein MsAm2_08480 [Methanosarcinaceae archaeon Am2]
MEIQFLFWPSILLSVFGSIFLTAIFYLLSRRDRKNNPYGPNFNDLNPDGPDFSDSQIKSSNSDLDETPIKTGGMIMLGPFPILFGNGGVRLDKKNFKYALLFFLMTVLVYLILIFVVLK